MCIVVIGYKFTAYINTYGWPSLYTVGPIMMLLQPLAKVKSYGHSLFHLKDSWGRDEQVK